MALLNIDFSQVEASTGTQPALPSGWQNVIIEESEHKPTANNATTGNELISVKMKVLDGPYAGRTQYKTFNYKNSNAQAQEIGWGEMKALNDALGIAQPRDTAEWHGKPFKAHFKYKAARTVPGKDGAPDKDYDESNDITGFKAANDTSVEVNHTVMKRSGGSMVAHSGIPGGSPVPSVGMPAGFMQQNPAVDPNVAPAIQPSPVSTVPAPVAAMVAPAPVPAPAPAPAPVYELRMTAKANGATLAQFRQDPAWTDELIVSQGFGEWVQVPAPAPLAPSAPAAPAAPAVASNPVQTTAPTGNPAPAGGAVPPWLQGK